jgi:dipeptidyl-peptidase-4
VSRLLLVLAAAIGFNSVVAGEDPSIAFFRDLAETRGYTLGQPENPQITSGDTAVLFLRGGPRDPVLRLYELDVASGRERELVTPSQILGKSEEVLSPEEKARRERTRTTLKGFTNFEVTKDGTRLFVTLSGKLYIVKRADLKVMELPGENWIAPHFSPDGAFVAAVKGGELNVIDLASLNLHAVTSGASGALSHGTAEFVAQEEMERQDGYWWSPDSKWLAYQETDDSAVETRYIADPMNPASPPQKVAYPRAGSANSKVRLGVVSRDGGATRWILWDAEKFPYLARVEWHEEGAPLTILVQDRLQHDERLLAVDAATGATRELLAETDPAWLNLVEPWLPHWLKGGEQFLWTTERRGFWQLELHDASGRLVRELTPIDFGYRHLVGVAEGGDSALVLGSEDPTEFQLWQIPLAGGPGKKLTTGRGLNGANLSRDGKVIVHGYSLLDGEYGMELLSADGAKLATLKSVAESPRAFPRVEITRTTGERSYYAAVLRPSDFQVGKKYPVILVVYAGPTRITVNAEAHGFFVDQWMADQGYIVARLDGRGTPFRGRDWERAIRGNLIDIALHDQIEGLQSLGAKYPEMDLNRVGVMGWSFGGYFSAMASIRRPDIFKAGVSGAPVVTWENYDTHYTERYLGLPQGNPEGYKVSSVLTYASDLARPLLLIHGLTDDNVYFQHSVQLADALFLAGKTYEFMPLLGTHMAAISSSSVQLREEQRIMEFFHRNL